VFSAITGTGGCGVYSSGSSSDFFAAGPGTNYAVSSSSRWKSDIVVMEGVLEKIASLEGVYYTWDKEHGGERDFGFIAEDVAKVFPEVTVPDPDAPGYSLGMDYGKMTPILLQAIKEQQKEIEELRQKSDEIELLRDEIEQLKSMVSTLVEASMK
jgi:hypothetical protein